MTKSAKHKLLRKKDKVKKQLASGIKKLSTKSSNIIDPKFKAKKIVLRDQELRSGGPEQLQPTTNRSQSLQDVLTSFNHHNTNIKQDALHGLQELVLSQPQILIGNLDSIIEKIGKLTSDIEGSVRRSNLKVAETIFAQITEDQLSPFWNLLLTHIQCTLTKLDTSVRYGALGFIRLLISYFPNLVSKSIETILSNLLLLISTTKTPTGTTPAPSGSGTTTGTVDFDKIKSSNKQKQSTSSTTKLKTDIKDSRERINVLNLISTCLDLYNSNHSKQTQPKNKLKDKEANSKNINQNSNDNHQIISTARAQVSETTQTYLGLYYTFVGYQETAILNYGNPLFQFDQSDASSAGTWTNKDDSSLFWPHFTESCISILCEIWLEIRPSNSTSSTVNDGGDVLIGQGSNSRGICNLSKSSIESLETIVLVLSQLLNVQLFQNETWKSIDRTNSIEDEFNSNICRRLRKNHGQQLKKYFFQLLPFSSILDTMKRQVTNLNLDLFLTAAKLRLVDGTLMNTLKNYIRLLTDKFLLDSPQVQQVFKILSLLHLSDVGEVISLLITYALNCGYHESINEFLNNALLRRAEETEKKNVLSSIDWNEVIRTMMEETCELTNEFVNLLTSISMKNILELRKLIEDNMEKIKQFLENRNYSILSWDQINRLFYYSGNLDLLISCGLEVPECIKSSIEILSL